MHFKVGFVLHTSVGTVVGVIFALFGHYLWLYIPRLDVDYGSIELPSHPATHSSSLTTQQRHHVWHKSSLTQQWQQQHRRRRWQCFRTHVSSLQPDKHKDRQPKILARANERAHIRSRRLHCYDSQHQLPFLRPVQSRLNALAFCQWLTTISALVVSVIQPK